MITKKEYYKTKNQKTEEKELGKKLETWAFGSKFWVKVFENGIKLRKRNQAEIMGNV